MTKNIFVILMLFIPVLIFAGGNKEKEETVKVTGVVRLVGPSLFAEIVISGAEHMWYIAKDEMKKLHDLQNRTVTVEGIESVRELKFANGMSAGTRRELRNIKIITTE